eukprot:gene20729-24845_t
MAMCMCMSHIPASQCLIVIAVTFVTNLGLALKRLTQISFKLSEFDIDEEEKVKRICGLLHYIVILETTQILVPLLYLYYFVVAFHSKGSAVMGNIKFGGWHFTRVNDEDLHDSIQNILLFFIIDVISFLALAGLLNFFLKIDMLKLVRFIAKEYGWAIAVQYVFYVELFACINTVECGMDLTFKFKWLE